LGPAAIAWLENATQSAAKVIRIRGDFPRAFSLAAMPRDRLIAEYAISKSVRLLSDAKSDLWPVHPDMIVHNQHSL
jgi:hypothetical protein